MRAEAFPSQPQWTEVSELDPDYLFILGDNIYMDYWPYTKNTSPKGMSDNEFEKLMKHKYELQWSEKHFSSLVESVRQKGGVYGTWDDHDFAWDNALGEDVSETRKSISRRLFNQYFYAKPSQDELYKVVDTEHARIIILDQRSYSQKVSANASLIGGAQLSFLEKSLKHSKPFTIVCGSLPLSISASILGLKLPSLTNLWSKYKREYQRFCQLLEGRENVVYIGGDIHRNDFAEPELNFRPCYEVVASGMAVDQAASQSVVKFKKPNRAYDSRKNWVSFDICSKEIAITLSSQTSIWKRKNKKFFIKNVYS
jgi:phosphodiesterase/alkaline phosphatase D-like protein